MNEPSFAIGVPGLETEKRQVESFMAHLVFALIGFVIPLFVYGNSQPSGCSGTLTACKSNCKNIATALEMYASDHKGLYPSSLQQLIPGNYLKKIPTCPAAGRVTYADYVVSAKRAYFHFACVGNNHARSYAGFSFSSNNFPHYSSVSGLWDHR